MLKVISALLTLTLVGCHMPVSRSALEQRQGVEGTVRYKPDYDHSDIFLRQNPPDLTPRALAGATVYLIRYRQQEIGQVNNRDILDSVVSDSLGRYRFRAAVGRYYLALGKSAIQSVVLKYDLSDSAGLNFPVSVIVLIEIPSGQMAVHDFEIHELTPQ